MKAANLALLNNLTLSKEEWFDMFHQVGLPRSAFFWSALLRHGLMTRVSRNQYLLRDVHPDTFPPVWEDYCKYNRAQAAKAYAKKKKNKQLKAFREELRNNRSERLVNYNGSYITWTDYKYEIENQ